MNTTIRESRKRSLIKAVSWRLLAGINTFLLGFLVTGNLAIASSISVLEMVTKFFFYYLHERFWARINIDKK